LFIPTVSSHDTAGTVHELELLIPTLKAICPRLK
jgi:hypothetical protein